MGLGSSCLEKVVIPYTNSPSTNPAAKVTLFPKSAKKGFPIKSGMTARPASALRRPDCLLIFAVDTLHPQVVRIGR